MVGEHEGSVCEMTHLALMVSWFEKRGGKATLEEILTSGEPWSYEFRARATDLRKKGFVIICERGTMPSFNRYTVIPPEENGQLRIAV